MKVYTAALLFAAAAGTFAAEYKVRQIGALNTEKYRVYLGKKIKLPKF